MSFWTILSWVGVAILTGVNVFIFLKLKKAAEQMLSVAFPGAKNMSEAMARMQAQMGGMGGMGRPGHDAQLRQAMALLQNKGQGRKR
jgi:hypothetical protein